MRRIALVHTVKSVYDTFEGQLREALGDGFGELKIHNLMDDFLANDPADTGVFFHHQQSASIQRHPGDGNDRRRADCCQLLHPLPHG